jgi:endonuclease V-like protein UPF0215 family
VSNYLGDYATSTTIYNKFTTYRPSTGAPFTLAGSPALSVYKDNSTTQSTAGVTLTADFDSITGLNHWAVDTSADGTFYSTGSSFDVVITTGTVDSISAVGSVVGSFTLNKVSALRPTTAGRRLDVNVAGEAGIDWANIGGQTTIQNLSATTFSTSQAVASVTGAVGSVTGSVGSVTATVSADVVSVSGDSAAADNIERWFDGTVGFGTSGSVITGSLSGSVGSIGTDGITAASIAASALDDKGNWLKPTVAGRTLDVTATGAAGIDWGNVEDQGALVDLTQTSVFQVTDANVSAIDNGVITASKFAASALDAVWSTASRTLTAATNITSTGGSVPITAGGLVSGDITAISTDTTAADNLERWYDGTVGFSTSGSVITGSLSGAVGSITGITFPANFSAMDINATGGVGIDWGNVQNPSTLVDLTQTFIAQVADVGGSVVIDGTSVTAIWANATRTLTAGTNIVLAKGVGVTGFNDLSAAQVNTEVDTGLADVGLTTTVTGRIDAAVSSRMATYTQPTGFLAATFPSTVASPTNITSATGVALSTAGNEAVADTTLRRTMANVEASASGDTLALSSIYGFVQMAQESAVSGTTLTVKKTDGTTTLGTKTVTTDAGADPITGVS